jgi:hypothetical protein
MAAGVRKSLSKADSTPVGRHESALAVCETPGVLLDAVPHLGATPELKLLYAHPTGSSRDVTATCLSDRAGPR